MHARILFITSNRLGDAVLSTGLLAWLLEKHQGSTATVVCGPIPSSLFEDVPGVIRVISLAKKSYSRHWWDLWQEVRQTKWDVIVDLRNTIVSRVLRSRQKLIFEGGAADVHKVDALGQLVGLHPGPQPQLWFNPQRQENARQRLALAGGKPVIVVGPAANWLGKEWPMSRFQELLRRLTAPQGPLADAFVALAAAPDERERAIKLWDVVAENRRIDLMQDKQLAQVAACIAQSTIYIGNDSGLMHIAAAIGIPTVGIFGPSDDRVYGPRGPLATLVRADRGAKELLAGSKDGRLELDTLMDDISVDAVYQAVCDVMARADVSPSSLNKQA